VLKFLNSRHVVGMLCLGLLALAAPSISHAQGIPPGTYSNTCTNIAVIDNTLEATCTRNNGVQINAALTNPSGCNYGVANQDGSLVCDSPPQMTSANADGEAILDNTCPSNEVAVYAIVYNSGVMAIYVNAGTQLKIDILRGTQYVAACGRAPTIDRNSQLSYLNVGPIP
jgi:hypothetical protein